MTAPTAAPRRARLVLAAAALAPAAAVVLALVLGAPFGEASSGWFAAGLALPLWLAVTVLAAAGCGRARGVADRTWHGAALLVAAVGFPTGWAVLWLALSGLR